MAPWNGPKNGCEIVCRCAVFILAAAKVQHSSVCLSGAPESLSVARGGISSTEVGISSARLTGFHCQEG